MGNSNSQTPPTASATPAATTPEWVLEPQLQLPRLPPTSENSRYLTRKGFLLGSDPEDKDLPFPYLWTNTSLLGVPIRATTEAMNYIRNRSRTEGVVIPATVATALSNYMLAVDCNGNLVDRRMQIREPETNRSRKRQRKREQRRAERAPYVSKRGDKAVVPFQSRYEPRDAPTGGVRDSPLRCSGCDLCRQLDDLEQSQALMLKHSKLHPNKTRFLPCSRARYAIYAGMAESLATGFEAVERMAKSVPQQDGWDLLDAGDRNDPILRSWRMMLLGLFNIKNTGVDRLGGRRCWRWSPRLKFIASACRATAVVHGARF
jgi:hypothetical protein